MSNYVIGSVNLNVQSIKTKIFQSTMTKTQIPKKVLWNIFSFLTVTQLSYIHANICHYWKRESLQYFQQIASPKFLLEVHT